MLSDFIILLSKISVFVSGNDNSSTWCTSALVLASSDWSGGIRWPWYCPLIGPLPASTTLTPSSVISSSGGSNKTCRVKKLNHLNLLAHQFLGSTLELFLTLFWLPNSLKEDRTQRFLNGWSPWYNDTTTYTVITTLWTCSPPVPGRVRCCTSRPCPA